MDEDDIEIGDPIDAILPEDFRFTADLLRRYMNDHRDLFRAVCSNNLSIILAALDQAGSEKQ